MHYQQKILQTVYKWVQNFTFWLFAGLKIYI